MASWKFASLDIEIENEMLKVVPTSGLAKMTLGGSVREIEVLEISGISYAPPTKFGLGKIDITASGLSTFIQYKDKEIEAANDFFVTLCELAPQAIGGQISKKRWTDTVEKIAAKNAAKEISKGEVTDKIDNLLKEAAGFAARGEIVAEHNSIIQALQLEKEHKLRLDTNDRIEKMIERGELRVNTELVGVVGLPKYVEKMIKGTRYWGESPGIPIEVYTDRIIQGSACHPIDGNTTAQVFLDGQQQITQHVQALDLLVFAPFPGSSLGAAMAMQKNKMNDMRTAEFQVASTNWNLRTVLNPNFIGEPRSIGERVNRIAESLSTVKPPQTEQHNPQDLNSQLLGLAELHKSGVLSDDEFKAAKAKLLG